MVFAVPRPGRRAVRFTAGDRSRRSGDCRDGDHHPGLRAALTTEPKRGGHACRAHPSGLTGATPAQAPSGSGRPDGASDAERQSTGSPSSAPTMTPPSLIALAEGRLPGSGSASSGCPRTRSSPGSTPPTTPPTTPRRCLAAGDLVDIGKQVSPTLSAIGAGIAVAIPAIMLAASDGSDAIAEGARRIGSGPIYCPRKLYGSGCRSLPGSPRNFHGGLPAEAVGLAARVWLCGAPIHRRHPLEAHAATNLQTPPLALRKAHSYIDIRRPHAPPRAQCQVRPGASVRPVHTRHPSSPGTRFPAGSAE